MRRALVALLLVSSIARAQDQMQTIQIGGQDQNVYLVADPKPMLDLLNQQAQQYKLNESFSSCQPAIDVAFGRGSNYGGYCKGSGNARMIVCADTMVGNFKAVPADRQAPTIEELTKFVLANCAGG